MPLPLTDVSDELPVHVNREGRRELDVPQSIEVTGSFDIRFVNHGEATHVHLNPDEALSRVTTVDAGNRHVPGDGERRVHVAVDTDAIEGESIHGTLEVATSYGAEQQWIDVEVKDPAVASSPVAVDESLGQPTPDTPSLYDRPELLVLGLGVLVLGLALLVGMVIEESLIMLGVGIVGLGVLVALVFLLK